jgi:3-hydroxybutyryl-CoA dehydrogenase
LATGILIARGMPTHFGKSLREAFRATAPTSTAAGSRSVIRLAPPGAMALVATQPAEVTDGRCAVVSMCMGARRGLLRPRFMPYSINSARLTMVIPFRVNRDAQSSKAGRAREVVVAQFKTVGVVGAGMMGSEIALVFALAGHPTIMSDQNRSVADKALYKMRGVLERGVIRKFWTNDAAQGALANLRLVDGLGDYSDRDLTIEAVSENEAVKRNLFARLDNVLAPAGCIASNTSSISITSLAAGLSEERRRRFIGTHFFSPVTRMQLVEVIPGLDTDLGYADAISETLRAIGKTPIRVKDVVGFAINRLLHALVIESIRLVEEGVCAPADIDLGCKLGLGHAIGPFELLDNTTNTLSRDVHDILYEAYGERFHPRPLLRQMVAAGNDGRNAGRGWYRYDKDGKRL